MKLKQSGPLAPVNEPWTLIRDAIHDLTLQEKLKGVKIRMSNWHLPSAGVCHQCLAGSVMSRRLGVDTNADTRPHELPDVAARLRALEELRCGEIRAAYHKLKLERPASLPVRVPIPNYHRRGPSAFKAAMRALADQLEAAQPTNQ